MNSKVNVANKIPYNFMNKQHLAQKCYTLFILLYRQTKHYNKKFY